MSRKASETDISWRQTFFSTHSRTHRCSNTPFARRFPHVSFHHLLFPLFPHAWLLRRGLFARGGTCEACRVAPPGSAIVPSATSSAKAWQPSPAPSRSAKVWQRIASLVVKLCLWRQDTGSVSKDGNAGEGGIISRGEGGHHRDEKGVLNFRG